MATYVQRAQAMADATLNRVATPAEIHKAARGLAYRAGVLEEYDALTTNAQRAEFYVKRMQHIQVSAYVKLQKESAGGSAGETAAAEAAAELAETP